MPVAHQDSRPEAGSSSDGDLQPGEKVLQDIKDWNGLERRLQEIQQQLETLSWSQELTVSSKRLCSLPHNPSQKNHRIHTWPVLWNIWLHPDAHACMTNGYNGSHSFSHMGFSTAETHVFIPLSLFACNAFGNNTVILSFNGQTCMNTSSVWAYLSDSISEMSNASP